MTTLVGRRVTRAGGIRAIHPPLRCPYCNRILEAWCAARKVHRWGPVTIEITRAICRRPECRAHAARDGWV